MNSRTLRILVKLVKFFNNKAADALEAYFQLPLLEQNNIEVRDSLAEAKVELAVLMTERDAVEREVKALNNNISETFGYLKAAKEANNEELKERTAASVAKLRNELKPKQQLLDHLNTQVEKLGGDIQEMQSNADNVENETKVVKATAAVQEVQDKIHGKFNSSKTAVQSSAEMLKKIKDRQQKTADMRANMEALGKAGTDEELEEMLEAAGLKKSDQITADDVLAELEAAEEQNS